MIEIDGGEGGGQLLRSALALSLLTGEGFEMSAIRGGRSNPGLRHQHLAAVAVAADIADAEVSDVDVGTEELRFEPRTVTAGEYGIDIGTAGSVPLLFDAVLPLATRIDGALSVAVRGGTDVKWSPTMAYYRQVKLPLLRRHGLYALVEVDRPGFYPAGGGSATLRLAPSSIGPFDLTERGSPTGARVYSMASADLADADVAGRQAAAASERLADAGLAVVERSVTYAESDSPGSALAVRLDYGGSIAGFDALGERGKPAEDVAAEAVEDAIAFDDGGATVDRHMADQLVVFLARSGGRVRVPELTDHVRTSLELLDRFGYEVTANPGETGPVLVG